MSVKKICAFFLCIAIVFAIQIPSVFASEEIVVYSDFEECIDTIKAPWKSQGHTTSAPVTQTERGISAVLETLPGKMEEVYCDFPETDENVKAMVIRYAIKICDSYAHRSVYSRTNTGEFELISFPTTGGVTIGGVALQDITIERNVWYDMYAVYMPLTGEIRLSVNDGQSIKSAKAACKSTNKTGLWRINFAAFSNKEFGTMTYLDDICVYTLDYVPDNFVGSNGETHDFEDFTSTDGKTPPKGWYLQNLGNGNASGTSVDSDDGKAIECRTDGTVNFELVKYFESPISGDGIIEFDFMRKENSGVRLGIRAHDSTNTQHTKWLMRMDSSGSATINDVTLGTLDANVWYKFKGKFNTQTHTCTFTVKSDEDSFEVNTTIPEEYVKLVAFEFYTPTTLGPSTFVVDNVFIGQEQEFGISSVTPAFDTINALTEKIEFTYAGDIADVSSGAVFTLNGDASYFNGCQINENNVILDLAKPLDYGKSYIFEARNLGGDSVSIVTAFLTEKRLCYTYHNITTGTDAVTANISARSTDGETYKITLLLAIYNKETGEMIDLTATSSAFGSEQENLSTSIPLPSNEGSYEAYAYVWDGADTMQSLTAPKIINIE